MRKRAQFLIKFFCLQTCHVYRQLHNIIERFTQKDNRNDILLLNRFKRNAHKNYHLHVFGVNK